MKVNGIAAFAGRANVTPYLKKALKALAHRAWQGYGVLTEEGVREYRDVSEIEAISSASIGMCLGESSAFGESNLVVHGQLTHDDLRRVQKSFDGDVSTAPHALSEMDGEFVVATLRKKTLFLCRDGLGVKPLYISKNGDTIGAASEMKALQGCGFSKIERVHPGSIVIIEEENMSTWHAPPFDTSPLNIDMKEAADGVRDFLSRSLRLRTDGVKKVGVSFSGGLDSSVIAAIASQFKEVHLISVAAEDSRDRQEAREAAEQLGMPLTIVNLSKQMISETLQKIRVLIENGSLMDIAIATALYLSALEARELGCDVLLLGQLADELFGGYARYVRILNEEGDGALQSVMFRDVTEAYRSNFERDEKATSPYAGASVPYASLPLVKFALRLPMSMKIDKARGTRKILLRKVAETLGLPDSIVHKPKKAVQYSSGIQKLISKVMV